ncbi:MAG TPA: squalene/phytoene synthase family protein [Solirubrobacteraceae bacterium]|nr:squalene/phytoene synthase family protein [Solirubrobacteraceae bacterium]
MLSLAASTVQRLDGRPAPSNQSGERLDRSGSGERLDRSGELPDVKAVMARASGENFPVALRLLGRRLRAHLLAIYGFARLVDEIGDESPGDRLALLERVERELDAPEHPVMCALARTVRECGLPREPLLALIEANRLDQRVRRYDSFEQLLDYCRLSAAPVGQLVLHVFGAATPARVELSDRVCAALQVIEHLQDRDEDRARGRHYIGPFDAAARARELLAAGPPLVRSLRGRPRLAVAGFLAGGRAALDGLDGRRRSFALAYLRAVSGR